MNSDKMVLLKANVVQWQYISLSDIKMKFDVGDEEAQEMLDGLIQGGLVEPYSFDGAHFKLDTNFIDK